MIQLVHPTRGHRTFAATQHGRLITCPSPTTWQMQRCWPTRRPSVRSPGSCNTCCRPSAARPCCPRLPSTNRRPFVGTRSLLRFPPRRSCDRLFVVPTVSRRRRHDHLITCCLMKNSSCQFAGPYPYEVCSSGPSTKCHSQN